MKLVFFEPGCLSLLLLFAAVSPVHSQTDWWRKAPNQCRAGLTQVLPVLSEEEVRAYRRNILPSSSGSGATTSSTTTRATITRVSVGAQAAQEAIRVRGPLQIRTTRSSRTVRFRSRTAQRQDGGFLLRPESLNVGLPCSCYEQQYLGPVTKATSALTLDPVQVLQQVNGASQIFHVINCIPSQSHCQCRTLNRAQNALIIGTSGAPEHALIWLGACCESI